jgi:predicted 2-oxoglutarate/Fe(II)-dependent dioxygenase YbiX
MSVVTSTCTVKPERERLLAAVQTGPRLPDKVLRLPGVMSPQDCAALIAHHVGTDPSEYVECTAPDREQSTVDLGTPEVLGSPLGRYVVSSARLLAASAIRVFNCSSFELFSIQILRYDPGHGMDWHTDDLGDEHTPWVALVVGLSDPSTYSGGLLEIEGVTTGRTLQPGEAVILPGHRRHRVHQVASGARYTLTAFGTGTGTDGYLM